jgi:pheromone alpha factor receptor
MSETAPAAPPAPFDPARFNPQHQIITMYGRDGSIIYNDMDFLNSTRLYTARFGISYGAQIGASFTLLIVLLLLTRPKKRKSAIFILNALCLFLNIWRCIFTACFLTGGFMHPYDLMSGFYSPSTKDVAFSVTSNVLSFLVTTLVMASLSLQVWVACVTTSNLQRHLIMGVTTATALVSVGIKLTFMILSNTATVQLVNRGVDKVSAYSWITQAVAVILYSCVFTWKLGYAIIQRRRLKMLQFGPMQIVFIMGCQTMTIPGKLTHSIHMVIANET